KKKESPANAAQDPMWFVGTFFIGDCGDKVATIDVGHFTKPMPTPDKSVVAFMGFNQELDGSNLTLYGPTPPVKAFEILKHSPSTYEVVRPADWFGPS